MGTLGTVTLDILAGLILVSGWYVAFVRYNRRRASEVLLWIRTAFCGHAQILGVHWSSPSRFRVKLRVVPHGFQHSYVDVRLLPREFFLNWLISKIRKQQEIATFEADLDSAPLFNLEVHNQRWCGRSRRNAKLNPRRGIVETFGPMVITTRHDWQREITAMIDALVASRDSDFLSVHFRRRSPHLSATVPLASLVPQNKNANQVFHVLRELADCAGASRF
ncbi:MAG: hypothetical protein ACXVZV_09935 [Terriglobales bacterium]